MLQGIWAISWRSVVFLPLMLCVAVLLLGLALSLITLPFLGVVYVYFGLWKYAIVSFVTWVLLIYVYRRFNISRCFERPPSYL